MRRCRFFFLWLGAAAILGGCAAPQFSDAQRTAMQRDFVRLDQAYIPALAMTNQRQPAASSLAMQQLVDQWARVRRALPSPRKDPNWEPDLRVVDVRIARAAQAVRTDRLAEAHEALEDIKLVLLRMRRRHAIEYYLDHLTEYHEIMEQIVRPAAKGGTTGPDRDYFASIEHLTRRARSQWQQVCAAPIDPELFGFGASATAQWTELLIAQWKALDELNAAVASADRARIASAAVALKPPFARLYMLFGKFPATQPASHLGPPERRPNG